MKRKSEMKPLTGLLIAGPVLLVIFTLLFGPLLGPIATIIGGIITWFQYRHLFNAPATPRAVKYDDAEFHDPDGNLEEEFAAAHIALFLRWCVERNLISKHLEEKSGDELAKARSGAITYTEFLLCSCDGKLIAEDFSEEGNRFATAYYDDYLRDYSTICGFPSYSHTEAEHDYAAVSVVLDRRLAEFRAGTLAPLRPKSRRWQFWKKS